MPEFHIDPEFSVYKLVKRNVRDNASLSQRRTMSLVSYEIENSTIIDHAKTVIFAGFQRMSRFLNQANRYRQLAANSQHIYVFGVPDVDVPVIPNITYVPLRASDQLAREWFLLSCGPTFYTALATEEQTYIDMPDHLRRFTGIWTFDPYIIDVLYDWLNMTVGNRIGLSVTQDHDPFARTQLMNNVSERLQAQLSAKGSSERIRYEIEALTAAGINPDLKNHTYKGISPLYSEAC